MTTPATTIGERYATAPTISRTAALVPTSWNAETRTIDVVWTTGSRGVKFDWATGELIDEELTTNAGNVRLDRLNGGAPVLNTHNRGDLSGQIGVVLPGSARMVGGQGLATLQLSDRDDLAPIVRDIAAGIIRNISVGYTVHTWEVERRAGVRALWRAIDWEPTEISFVPVPFDAGAQVRASVALHPCTIRTIEGSNMDPENLTAAPAAPVAAAPFAVQPPAAAPAGQRAATIPELRSYFDLAQAGGQLSAADAATLVLNCAERGLTMSEVRSATLAHLRERQRDETARGAFSGIGRGDDTMANPQFQARAIEDALYARMSGTAPTEHAREFMGMTMVQMAGELIERNGGRTRSMTANEIIQAAGWNHGGSRMFAGEHVRVTGMHTTSDFPDLLMGAGQRFLLEQFGYAGSALKTVGRRRTARDFRAISGLQLSGFGTLLKVEEAGEIKHGTFKSRTETYRLETFAKQFALSRQAIINDDLGAFGDPVRVMARAAAETEATILADLIEANPTMADGKAMYHADHGNLAASGTAPSISTLSAGRLAMRSQKDLDGVTPLASAPKYIVTGAQLETEVEALVASINPAQVGDVNNFAGKLTPLVEPRFDGKAWHLFADPSVAPVLEYAYLDGNEGPTVESRDGWDTLGTQFRVYMDFGAGLVDYRGTYKNPGAA